MQRAEEFSFYLFARRQDEVLRTKAGARGQYFCAQVRPSACFIAVRMLTFVFARRQPCRIGTGRRAVPRLPAEDKEICGNIWA